jgi:ATP-dependent helicase/nuclease subunit B
MSGVFTIASGAGFLDALARGLIERHGEDPFGLGRITVLLPTRRACRALTEAFLRLREGRAMLLPRLRPLGDLDADEPELAADLAGTAAWTLPQALPALRRQLLLTRLVRRFGAQGRNADAAQAALLAGALARLMDDVQTEQLSFDRLADLVPAAYAEHWQLTLKFLEIVTKHWPRILAEEGVIGAIDRRNRVTQALAETWQAAPPPDPIVAAGTTGSIPATAQLLAVIAKLPHGAIVLPALDQKLDRRSWQALEPTHPQWGLKQLLDRLNLGREDVQPWVAANEAPRAALLREALRPSATSEEWQRARLDKSGLDGIARVDCRSRLEEATAVALALRHALETPGRTAVLVTPDRELARRVAAELGRFGIEIDDSAGRPLALTPPGAFLRLVAACAAERAAPVPLLAMLKHPLAGGGENPARFRSLSRQFERAVLRGPRPAPGFGQLIRSLGEDAVLALWLRRLAQAADAFFAMVADAKPRPLAELAAAHVGFAEWLAADSGAANCGAGRLWAGETGEAAAQFVHELLDGAGAFGALEGTAYPALFDTLIAAPVVRPRWGRHPRLAIWGPLEARLQQADLVVLGGLNEGTWPAEVSADPWLSRPMRTSFGLPLDERRIGQAAHDFASLAAAPEVLLTRAAKVDGVPTVPSRWLLRLDGVLGAEAGALLERGARWRAWAERLDEPTSPPTPVGPPEPRPPVAARPRRLSVTQVELWMRDPYAVFARYILDLRPLDPLDADPGAADRGIIVHRALELFLKETQQALPEEPLPRLLEIGRAVFGPALQQPGIWAFWWPRFRRVAEWIVTQERRWRRLAAPLAAECRGELVFAAPAGEFRLTATADRIDRLADGLAIIDYKTGRVPSREEIAAGFAPQLPLEAAIAMRGGFAGVTSASAAALLFWRVSGGREPGKVITAGDDPLALAAAARDGLARLITVYDRPETPYPSRPRPDFAPSFSDYLHLARVAEWSSGDAT